MDETDDGAGTARRAEPPAGVQSLDRGLAVIRAFDAEHGRMTLSEVARRTDLSRATARRFLHTLVALGYMSTDGREFWLRPKILELGYAYLSSMSLPEIVTPHLRELSDLVHESSSFSVLDETDVVYVARIPARRIMAVAINVGTRFPAYATSMGRAILSRLPEADLAQVLDDSDLVAFTPRTLTTREDLVAAVGAVRDQGYALVDEELETGLRSLAVPILSRDGEVAGAINISVPSVQVEVEEMRERLLPMLRETKVAIEADLRLGYTPQRRVRR